MREVNGLLKSTASAVIDCFPFAFQVPSLMATVVNHTNLVHMLGILVGDLDVNVCQIQCILLLFVLLLMILMGYLCPYLNQVKCCTQYCAVKQSATSLASMSPIFSTRVRRLSRRGSGDCIDDCIDECIDTPNPRRPSGNNRGFGDENRRGSADTRYRGCTEGSPRVRRNSRFP